MKRTRIFAAAAALILSMSGCGRTSGDTVSESKADTAVKNTAQDNTSEAEQKADNSGSSQKKPAHAEVGNNGAAAVTDVLLIPDDDEDISHKVDLTDMFGRHVLHTGVVGLVGAPVEVEYDSDEVKGGKLVFVYDPDELEGVRPDALMFMWYDEDNNNYVELPDGKLNTENCSMTIHIDKPGTYLLVNKYKWYNCWGADLDDNGLEQGYDPSSKPLDDTIWSKNEDVGDIPELADMDYISSCRQSDPGDYYVFDVSTPEQLASAVYFVNCVNDCGTGNPPSVTINLQNDIDLEGYKWSPMGWYGAGLDYDFCGDFNGNGHTIKNMTIEGGYHVGFIGCGLYCSVYDVNFENANVSGANPGVLIGYARDCDVRNCHVQGVTSGSEAGGICSIDQSSHLYDCTADVIANGESLNGFLSGNDLEASKVAEQHEPTEKLWLDEKGRLCREEGIEEKYRNLGWNIKRGGEQVLDRSADNETVFDWRTVDFLCYEGHYEVTLTAFVDGYYIPISNTVEYNVE